MSILDFFMPNRGKSDQMKRQLVQLERKVDLILENLGLEYVAEDSIAEVKRMLDEGRKIHAVKSYWEMYPGLSLREAKEAVDSLQVE